jgi:hypothetical protein
MLRTLIDGVTKSPQTSLAGGGLGLAVLLVGVIVPLIEGEPLTLEMVVVALLAIGLIWLGFVARDWNKSSQDVGIRPKDEELGGGA